MMCASLQFSAKKYPAQAAVSDNVMGWLWADPIGWTSMNDTNPSSCSPGPCGTYGVNVNISSGNNVNGFAWNDYAGWICFGDSCTAPACNGLPPSGSLQAWVTALSGTSAVEVHGWAKVCNEGAAGWISLDCTDQAGACASFSYKVMYNPLTKYFTNAPATAIGSLAWNGNTDGSGFGYLDFSKARVNTAAESNTVTYGPNSCKDGSDNDFNGRADCADPGCAASPFCTETSSTSNFWGGNLCGDGIDDNGNGQIDCAESNCAGYPGPPNWCVGPPAGEAAATDTVTGAPLGANAACSDLIDNDFNGPVDCNDLNCQAYATICVPAFLRTTAGNLYGQQGLVASSSVFITQKSAQYCLGTLGAITGFTSQSGCTETNQPVNLPKGSTGYQGTLGSLDINGILTGRYGKVVELGADVDATSFLPNILNGQVYHATGNVTLGSGSMKMFNNGSGSTQRGNGLLIVEGDLTITGDSGYGPTAGVAFLRNVASFGVIVKKDSLGARGNIRIQENVRNLVGAYFAEEAIYTGTKNDLSPGGMDGTLTVSGLFAARHIELQRNYRGDPTTPAESVTFDGRTVANPPPGMADISKSLPTSKDAY